jgi:DNA-binding transcriptional ArsR family regulator
MYMLIASSKSKQATVRLSVIAHKCRINDKSYASKIVDDLVEQGFLTKTLRYNQFTGLQLASTYQIKNYRTIKDDYFILPSNIFKYRLPSKCLALTAYLFAKGFTGETYPSLFDISRDTGMSKTTILKHISLLQELGIIIKRGYRKLDGSFGHNRYFIIFILAKRAGNEFVENLRAFIAGCPVLNVSSLRTIKAAISGRRGELTVILPDEEPNNNGGASHSTGFFIRLRALLAAIFTFFIAGRSFFTTLLYDKLYKLIE